MGCGVSKELNMRTIYDRQMDTLPEDLEGIANCLESCQLISSYLKSNHIRKHEQYLRLAEFFKSIKCRRGDLLCEAGQESHYLYVLKTGTVREVLPSQLVSAKVVGYSRPTVFGEADFMDHKSCVCGYRMETPGVIHFIEYYDFLDILASLVSRDSIADCPLFADTPPDELLSLDRKAKKSSYLKNTLIVRKDTPADIFYIIAKGQVKVIPDDAELEVIMEANSAKRNKKRPVQLLPTGSLRHDQILSLDTYFGEDCLILNQPYPVHVIALTDVEMFEIKKEHFETCMPTVFKLLEERVLREEKKKQARKPSNAAAVTPKSGGWFW